MSDSFPPGLSMLWETAEPTAALTERFGLASLAAAQAWVADVLDERWGLGPRSCDRVVISDRNALAWVGTDAGAYVVKIASHEPAFTRLDAIAELLGRLDDAGLPVAAPVPDLTGRRRAVVATDRPLSLAVHPLIDGDLLDVSDLAAVRATGELVGRLHTELAGVDPEPFADGPREISGDLRAHLASALDRLPSSRAPRAHARLAALLAELPDLDVPPQLGHGDVRGANVLVRDHRVAALLDFDEVSIRHRIAELSLGAVLLATEFRRWPPAPVDAQRALVQGYEGVVQLTDAERAWGEALRLWFGLGQIPPGDDPDGWAAAIDRQM